MKINLQASIHLSGKQLNAPVELALHQPTGIILPQKTDIIYSEIPKPSSKKKRKQNKKLERKWTYNDLINALPKSEPPKYKKNNGYHQMFLKFSLTIK